MIPQADLPPSQTGGRSPWCATAAAAIDTPAARSGWKMITLENLRMMAARRRFARRGNTAATGTIRLRAQKGLHEWHLTRQGHSPHIAPACGLTAHMKNRCHRFFCGPRAAFAILPLLLSQARHFSWSGGMRSYVQRAPDPPPSPWPPRRRRSSRGVRTAGRFERPAPTSRWLKLEVP